LKTDGIICSEIQDVKRKIAPPRRFSAPQLGRSALSSSGALLSKESALLDREIQSAKGRSIVGKPLFKRLSESSISHYRFQKGSQETAFVKSNVQLG
jgi:hypothetical protein